MHTYINKSQPHKLLILAGKCDSTPGKVLIIIIHKNDMNMIRVNKHNTMSIQTAQVINAK